MITHPYTPGMPDASEPSPTPARAATVRDVAARAGVSTATVSRVLTGNRPVSAEVRRRVRKAIEDLDYVVNEQARSLSVANSRTVAILLADITWPFHNQVARGVEQEAVAEDRMCLVCTTMDDPDREMALIELLRKRNTEAVVLIGGVRDSPEYRTRIGRLAQALDGAGSRLVFCGRPTPDPALPITVVEYDNEGGAFAAVCHLLSLGHRRIAFLGGPPGYTTTAPRLAGYRRALRDFGVEPDPALVRHCRPDGEPSRQFGYRTVQALVEQGPLPFTALFCYDDLVAAGAMAALREAGVDVPGDISVVGYNDEPTALDVVPGLTTVHVPHLELGRTAMRLALHRDDPMTMAMRQNTVLGTHLVIRGTVRRPAS